jgi:hypothetical protein
MMHDTDNEEADEIVARIEELEILQQALQQFSETLELFLQPAQPIKRRAMR